MRLIGEGRARRRGRAARADCRRTLPTRLHGYRRYRARSGALRDYGIGAQILIDLGVRDMILLSNTERTIVGLDGYGLRVVGRQPHRRAERLGDGGDRAF